MLPDGLRTAAARTAGVLALAVAATVAPVAAQAAPAQLRALPAAPAGTAPVTAPPAPAYDLATPGRPATGAACGTGCAHVTRDSATSAGQTLTAVGDGVADDTAALQAFLDTAAATGRTRVFLPHGVYRVTRQVDVPAGVKVIEGEGMGAGGRASVLRLDWASVAGFPHQFVLRSTDAAVGVTVRNLVVDGGRRAELGAGCAEGEYDTACPRNAGGGIKPGNGWTVQQVRFVGLNYFKLWVCDVTGVTITGARFDNRPVPAALFPADPAAPGGGTPLSGGEDNIGGGCGAANVTIERTMWDRSAVGNAIDLTRASGVRFRDNVVLGRVPDGDPRRASGSVIFEGVVGAKGAATEISGNRLHDAGMSIISNGDYCTHAAASARRNGTINPRGLVVRRNTVVRAPVLGIAVRYDGSDIVPLATRDELDPEGFAPDGRCVPKDSEASQRVSLGGGNTIADNTVIDPAQIGVLVWGTDERWKDLPDRVTGNVVENPGAYNDGRTESAWRQDYNTGATKFPLAGIALGIGRRDLVADNRVSDSKPTVPAARDGITYRPLEQGIGIGARPVSHQVTGEPTVLAQPTATVLNRNTTTIGGLAVVPHHPLPQVTGISTAVLVPQRAPDGTVTQRYVAGVPTNRVASSGGTKLLVRGQGFSHGIAGGSYPANRRVRFGADSTPALDAVPLSDTELLVTAPALQAGTGITFSVSNAIGSTATATVRGRSSTTSRLLSPQWTLTASEPDRATLPAGTLLPASGGTVLVGSQLSFGDSAAGMAAEGVTVTVAGMPMRPTYVDAGTITVPVSPGPPGTPVEIQVSRGGLPGVPVTARYAAALSGVSPAAGPLAGGTTVRVVGRGLAGSSDWRVGGRSATCTVAGDTAATCVVPAGLAAGPAAVTFTPAGGAPYLPTAKAAYTYR